MSRNIIDLCKTSIIYLLLTALLVEIDNLDTLRVVEISYMRIVKGNVTVLTDTQENNINRMLFKYLVLSLNLFLRITFRSDELYACER